MTNEIEKLLQQQKPAWQAKLKFWEQNSETYSFGTFLPHKAGGLDHIVNPDLSNSDSETALLELLKLDPLHVVNCGKLDSDAKATQAFQRPAFFIRNGEVAFDANQENAVWVAKLNGKKAEVEKVIAATGCVRTPKVLGDEVLGAAWMVKPGIMITAGHVVPNRYISQDDELMGAFERYTYVEMAGEDGGSPSRTLKIGAVLWVPSAVDDPDIAVLRVSDGSMTVGDVTPVPTLADAAPQGADQPIAIIGYPCPGRGESAAEMECVAPIFGTASGVKRLSPGLTLAPDAAAKLATHDASTLIGNSGSPVVDLDSGEVVAVHLGGAFRRANHAVPIERVVAKLKDLNLHP